MNKNSTSLYDVLEVAESASQEVIRAAYLTLAKKYHPDVYTGDPSSAAEIMKLLNSAYETLSDPDKRQRYDWYLNAKRKQEAEIKRNVSSDNGGFESVKDYQKSNFEKAQHKHDDVSSKSARKNSVKGKHKNISIWNIAIWLIMILFVGSCCIVIIYPTIAENNIDSKIENNADSNSLEPQPEPATGALLYGYYGKDSQITVKASPSASCVVKLKDFYDTHIISFYVRAGTKATVGVPAGSYYVYFASGKTWYGKEKMFGKDTYYSMDDELLNFTSHTWEYELQEVSNGNFHETPINAEEFN